MSRDRKEHGRPRSKFVTFIGCVDRTKDSEQVEVRTHVRNLVLINRINSKNPGEGKPEWFDFQVEVGSKIYFVDEKTYRRLISCFSPSNS